MLERERGKSNYGNEILNFFVHHSRTWILKSNPEPVWHLHKETTTSTGLHISLPGNPPGG